MYLTSACTPFSSLAVAPSDSPKRASIKPRRMDETGRSADARTTSGTCAFPRARPPCCSGSLPQAECYITPASDGWLGGADFSAAAKTSCPANSTCMARLVPAIKQYQRVLEYLSRYGIR
mgnify:CR=1 FL=1